MEGERVAGRLIERVYHLDNGADVHINNVRGSVHVIGTDGDKAHLHLEVDPEHRLSDAELVHAPIDLSWDDHQLSVKVVTEQIFQSWFEGRGGPPPILCTLYLPRQAQVAMSTVSAESSVANIEGPVRINTVSGNIVATEIEGSLHCNTVSGDAVVTHSTGTLHWNTVSGTLRVRQSSFEHLKGNAVSGAIVLELELMPAEGISSSTVSGDLRLLVPAGFGCQAQLTSMNGRAHIDLPVTVVEERRGRWEGRINDGGALVRLSSMSGSLYVTTSAQSSPGAEKPSSDVAANRETELAILRQIERREISIDEGLKRLGALHQPAVEGEVGQYGAH